MDSSRFLVTIAVLSGLIVSGCVPAKKQSAAAGGPLPLKAARAPSSTVYSYGNGSAISEPNDQSYDGSGEVIDEYGLPALQSISLSQVDVFSSLQAKYAWGINTNCSNIILGMVDSGIDTSHPDLSANLHNIGTVGAPVYGRNFVEGVGSSNVLDDEGHGTHVAGLMAASGNNNRGVTGICWTAKILTAKVTDSNGDAFLSDVVDGLTWTVDQGASVVNISMGSYVPATTLTEHLRFEDAFAGATSKAAQRGAIIVAAAGNAGSNSNINRTYPANLTSTQVISVSMNWEGNSGFEGLVSASNYGGNTVHLSAPGQNLMSTLRRDNHSTYGRKTGTSMASPIVAGSLALMRSHIIAKGKQITSLQLIDLFLNHLTPHQTTSNVHPELNVPGKSLITGAKLDLGNVMGAADAY